MRRTLSLAAAFALAIAGQAFAHARLIHAMPKVGSTVSAAPAELKLSFSESIVLAKSNVVVSGPAGRVATGPLALDGHDPRLVHVPLRGALGAGTYKVQWGMTTTDTHHTEGDFAFKVGR